MSQTLKPVTLEDIKNRVRWYVKVRWIFVLGLGLSGVVPSYFEFEGRGQFLTNVIIMFAGLGYNGIFWLLARRNVNSMSYYRWHGISQLVSDTLLTSYLIFTHGGIESRSIIIYTIPIIASGALFGSRAVFKTAISTIVAYNLILFGDFFGFMPSQGNQFLEWHGSASFLATSVLFYSGTLAVIAMIGNFVLNMLESEKLKAQTDRDLLDKAQAMVNLGNWEWDVASNSVKWSSQLYKIFQVEPSDLKPNYEGFLELVHPNDKQRVDAVIKQAFADGKPFAFDHHTNTQPIKIVHAQGEVIKDASGKVIALRGTAQDVTTFRVQQSQLDAERNRFATEVAKGNALFESIAAGVVATDESGKIVRINKVALKLLGFSEQEVIGHWFPKTIAAYDDAGREIPPIERPVTKAVLEGEPITTKLQYKTKPGPLIPVALTVSPIMLETKPIGAVVVFRDITGEKKLEEAKDMFVSLTSHQLRTPLTAIRLFAEMLGDGQVGPLNPGQADYVEKIEVSTKRMIQLVGEILNLSRIELGRLKVEPKPVDMISLIKTSVDEVMPLANERDMKIIVDLPTTEIPKVDLDEVLFDQVIHNLLTNAIRYSKPQGGQVKVSLIKETTGYHLSVADNGIGIPVDMQHRIFERFFRAENAISAVGEGTGLGLYLIRMIIQTAGGKIWFESKEGIGTTFHVTIPLSGMRSKEGDKSLTLTKD